MSQNARSQILKNLPPNDRPRARTPSKSLPHTASKSPNGSKSESKRAPRKGADWPRKQAGKNRQPEFNPEILVRNEYPFSIFVRGYPKSFGDDLQLALCKFQRYEESLSRKTLMLESSGNPDPETSLDIIEQTYNLAKNIYEFLVQKLPDFTIPPISCRVPDLFPQDNPLASKVYWLDSSGKCPELEDKIHTVKRCPGKYLATDISDLERGFSNL